MAVRQDFGVPPKNRVTFCEALAPFHSANLHPSPPELSFPMRYLVKARVKPGREKSLLAAIRDGSLGRGSIAGDE